MHTVPNSDLCPKIQPILHEILNYKCKNSNVDTKFFEGKIVSKLNFWSKIELYNSVKRHVVVFEAKSNDFLKS